MEHLKRVLRELEASGFHHCLAVATDAEIQKGAACGQLAVIVEEVERREPSALPQVK